MGFIVKEAQSHSWSLGNFAHPFPIESHPLSYLRISTPLSLSRGHPARRGGGVRLLDILLGGRAASTTWSSSPRMILLSFSLLTRNLFSSRESIPTKILNKQIQAEAFQRR